MPIELSSPPNSILHYTYTVCRYLMYMYYNRKSKENELEPNSHCYISLGGNFCENKYFFLHFWKNISRTTWIASAYHQWYAYHRLGTPGLDCHICGTYTRSTVVDGLSVLLVNTNTSFLFMNNAQQIKIRIVGVDHNSKTRADAKKPMLFSKPGPQIYPQKNRSNI